MSTLYVVATPIGNLGDLSPRALEVLRTVDFIAAEDTRVGAKLLHKFEIKKQQVSYYEHNRRQKGLYIAERIRGGESCALITDAGTPAISDPGCDLVALCAEQGIEVVSVPGCCAAVAALSIAGIDCGRFCFEGFLSTAKKNRRAHLLELREERRTMVFYEAPHKLRATLQDLHDTLGDRPCALCRELSKLHEQVLRTTLSGAIAHYAQTAPRGEFVLVIAGFSGDSQAQATPVDYLALVGEAMAGGLSLTQAVREVSRAHSTPKNALYQQALAAFGDSGAPADAE